MAKTRNLEFIRQINIRKSLTLLTYLTFFPHCDSKDKNKSGSDNNGYNSCRIRGNEMERLVSAS